MNGFLFDENLPSNIQFTPSFLLNHVSILGESPTDTQIWNYAQKNNLVIVTKDADFSVRINISSPPPRVIHLRFGNMGKRDFQLFLTRIWPQVEELVAEHRLVNVYLDRFETVE